ncbi:hypothetical protein AB4Y42_02250 [Paraburkholderia sp. EG286B]|uniref:hypothetical protein n=1 Tax=Paraburkholderia sp. EG286B TaxID=3237011 RepID=UPI0034D1CEAE
MAAPKLVSAVVAPGRTVFSEAVVSKVWDADAKRDVDVVKPGDPKGPGETVSLPEPEVKRLRALGFLLKEGAEPGASAPGPSFGTTEGPQIKVA